MKQGWEILEFEHCLEKVIYTNKIQRKDFKEEGIYPIVSQEKEFVNGYWDEEDDIFRIDKPVVIFGDHTQVIKFVDFDFVLGADGVKILKPKDELEPKYLYYFLQNVNLGSLGYARHYRLLKEINVTYPKSLTEQQRIVSILDKVFAAIDKAKANAEQNLKNAHEVFDCYLQEIFDKKDESWNVRSLKELTTKIGSGATPRGGRESYKKEGISLVRSMNVHDWEFKYEKLAYIDNKQAKELEGVTLQENDVLLNITGASVARCCIIPKEYLPARVNQHVSIIRPKKDVLDANFLNFLLTSKPYKDQLLIIGEQGSTRQAITKAQIEAFKIIFPDYKEQQSIVNKLDALRAETQKLKAIYQKKLDSLEELKKSVLQKAFAGELIEDV